MGNVHTCQSRFIERIVTDGGNRVGDGDTAQTGAVIKCIIANGCDGIGDGHVSQTAAAIE